LSKVNSSRGLFHVLIALTLITLLLLPSAVKASPSVVASVASNNCQVNGTGQTSFNCILPTSMGDTIVAFFGCWYGYPNACATAAVSDSEGNVFSKITNVTVNCDNGAWTCSETAFWARASSSGIDTFTFTSSTPGYLGVDLYDVSGIDSAQNRSSIGMSSYAFAPSVFSYAPYDNGFVAAGVVAGSPGQFTAGNDYTMIEEQPTPGLVGDFQGGEYALWGQTSTTTSPFVYPTSNDGWAEVSVSFAPISVSSSSQSSSMSASTEQVAVTSTVTTSVGTVTDYTSTNVISTVTATTTVSAPLTTTTLTSILGVTTIVTNSLTSSITTTTTVTVVPWFANPGDSQFWTVYVGTFFVAILLVIGLVVQLRKRETKRGK